MSKELILRICKEVINGRDFYRNGFNCEGINCCECPFKTREKDGILGCHDRTSEETIKIAKKYIAENTEFDWEEFKNGSIAVHCDTEEKAKDFLKKCDKRDIKWSFGKGIIEGDNRWNCYKEKTCYSWYFEGIIFENIDKEDLKIIKWEIKGKKEIENKFKVGDRVKKVDNRTFSNGDYVVTVKEIIKNRVWFKETNTSLNYREVKLAEETIKTPNTELTFKEFVNEAEESKIYVSENGAEFYKEYGKIIIDLHCENKRVIIPDDAILTLKKQEYTFTEAIEKAREGNTIKSLVSEEFYSPVEVKSGKAIFELTEIEGKWNVED